jgi:hypothetical protein
MKYIFVTGAPGSKWSSVVKHINSSADLDQTDLVSERSYAHKDQYNGQPMHIGAYWDPGMEFDFPENIESMHRDQIETIFDQPFSGPGVRIVKSHTLAHHIDFIHKTWPDSPVVLVYRADDACFGWWVRCGGFNISYPTYHSYYRDLPNMAVQIDRQNADILRAWHQYTGHEADNNYTLANTLGIRLDSGVPIHDYASADIKVKILAPASKS